MVSGIIFLLTYQLVTCRWDDLSYRAAVGISFGAGFMLMWGNFVQMADVTPIAATYFAVPLVGLIGAAFARLRHRGMAIALSVMAVLQFLVWLTAVALRMTGNPELSTWTLPQWRGLGGSAVFAGLSGISAWLFRNARQRQAETQAPLTSPHWPCTSWAPSPSSGVRAMAPRSLWRCMNLRNPSSASSHRRQRNPGTERRCPHRIGQALARATRMSSLRRQQGSVEIRPKPATGKRPL